MARSRPFGLLLPPLFLFPVSYFIHLTSPQLLLLLLRFLLSDSLLLACLLLFLLHSLAMLQTAYKQPSPTIHTSSPLLSLPYEVLLDVIANLAKESPLYPSALLNLAATCHHFFHIIQSNSIWQHAFSALFDTAAIYRRRLHYDYNWKAMLKRRCRALRHCATGVQACTTTGKVAWLDTVDWQCLWDMITEHGKVLKFQC